MTAVEPIGDDGRLLSHLSDHVVQVQNPALGWTRTCQDAQQQGEDMSLRGSQWTPRLVPLLHLDQINDLG